MSGPRLVVALLSFVLDAVCLGLGVSVTLWSLFFGVAAVLILVAALDRFIVDKP